MFQGLKLSTVASLTKSVPTAWSVGAKNVVDDIFYSPAVRLSHKAHAGEDSGSEDADLPYDASPATMSLSLLVSAASKDLPLLQQSLCLGTMNEAGAWSCSPVSEWIVGLKDSFVTTVTKVPLPPVGTAAVYAIILAVPKVPVLSDVDGPWGPRDDGDGDADDDSDVKHRGEYHVKPLIIGAAVVAVVVLCGVGALIARVVVLRARARALQRDGKSSAAAADAAAIAAAMAASTAAVHAAGGAFDAGSHLEGGGYGAEKAHAKGEGSGSGGGGGSSAELERINVEVEGRSPPNVIINPVFPGPAMHITVYGAASASREQQSQQSQQHHTMQQQSMQQSSSKQASMVTFGETRYLPAPPRLQSHSSSTSSRMPQHKGQQPHHTDNSAAYPNPGAVAPMPEPAALVPSREQQQRPASPPGQVHRDDSVLSAPHSPGVPLMVGGEGTTPLSPDMRAAWGKSALGGGEDLDDDYGGQDPDEAFSFTTTAPSGKSLSTRGKAKKEREVEKKENQAQQAKLISEFEQGLDGLLSLMQMPVLPPQ